MMSRMQPGVVIYLVSCEIDTEGGPFVLGTLDEHLSSVR